MMEMVVILAKIVQSHDLSFTGKAPEMSPKMTLRSKEDILISV
jgi:hypothetical protein